MQPTKKPPVKIDNPFEKVAEFAQDSVKQAIDVFNPVADMFGKPEGAVEMEGKNNHSQVDFSKLEKAYAAQDQEAIEKYSQELNPKSAEEQAHRKRHQEVKREEEEYYMRTKQEEAEKVKKKWWKLF